MLYRLGDQFLIEGQIWEFAEFGTDADGYLCARLEWRDVPDEMQKRYEVPPSMIVRDLASLQPIPHLSEV